MLVTENGQSLAQYDEIIGRCRDLFIKKTTDYGTAWRVLRLESLTDQIFIKARRVRSIQEKGVSMVGESVEAEFIGMVNYGLMALIQIELGGNTELDLPLEQVSSLYDQSSDQTRKLFIAKNHDYGEAWRDMRISSITDLILMKILRIKQIENNSGETIVSEGVDANYMDIVNYAIFALLKMGEGEEV